MSPGTACILSPLGRMMVRPSKTRRGSNCQPQNFGKAKNTVTSPLCISQGFHFRLSPRIMLTKLSHRPTTYYIISPLVVTGSYCNYHQYWIPLPGPITDVSVYPVVLGGLIRDYYPTNSHILSLTFFIVFST